MTGKMDKCNQGSGKYRLRLYVAGDEVNSKKAKDKIQQILENHFKGRYILEIVDIFEDLRSAMEDNIIVAPTLVIEGPGDKKKKVIGSLEDERKLKDIISLMKGEQDPNG
jgi:circadian clock protein KaiB